MKTIVCGNCKRVITPQVQSPERDVCGECHIYLQDMEAEGERQIVTREMAMDAGMPEIEGSEY